MADLAGEEGLHEPVEVAGSGYLGDDHGVVLHVRHLVVPLAHVEVLPKVRSQGRRPSNCFTLRYQK